MSFLQLDLKLFDDKGCCCRSVIRSVPVEAEMDVVALNRDVDVVTRDLLTQMIDEGILTLAPSPTSNKHQGAQAVTDN